MSLSHPTPSTVEQVEASQSARAGLHGFWLGVVRLTWLIVVTLTLLLFAIRIPTYMRLLQTVCPNPVTCPAWQPTPVTVAGLQQWHVSLGSYAAFNLTLTLLSAVFWGNIGLFLFWRKSNEWIVLVFSLQAVAQGVAGPADFLDSFPSDHSLWQIPTMGVNIVATVTLWLILALFPNGRFLPRWTKWAVIVSATIYLVMRFIPALNDNINPIEGLFFLLTTGSLLGAQIYRYARVSTLTQRQQTKWVVLSLAIVLLVQIGFAVPLLVSPALNQPGSLYLMINETIDTLILLLVPPAIAMALLRYKLWDVDMLIHRTLVYGILTLLLAGIYVGLALLSGTLLGGMLGQKSNVALVISTLSVAALFQPLRQRIQQLIDRSFYRQKYNAAKIMEAFAATLRQDIDLNQLSEHLLSTIQETMQPTFLSLWFLYPQKKAKQDRLD